MSLYFKTHRQEYYAQLQNVRETGDWESWLGFFLDGVNDIAVQATDAAREILALIQTDRAKIADIGRGAGSVLQAHQYLEKKPLVVIPEMVKALGLTTPTVTAALQNLAGLGIVREITGKQRGRVFVYDASEDLGARHRAAAAITKDLLRALSAQNMMDTNAQLALVSYESARSMSRFTDFEESCFSKYCTTARGSLSSRYCCRRL